MLRIDSHQHFWEFDEGRDNWITDEMNIIRRDFLPGDLYAEMHDNGVSGCVAVQADQSEKETRFLVSLATDYPFVKGVVGWIDLCANDIDERLGQWQGEKKLKGFRHILQGEANPAFMLTPAFTNGIKLLKPFNYTYDILIFPHQLLYLPEFLQHHPEQKFVIDHIAKPGIKGKEIEDWKKKINLVAQYPNVCCKISGLATEADWQHWKPQDLKPYLDVVWEAFGAGRLMFGSDWPVCLLATTYRQWIQVLENYLRPFTQAEKESFWSKNASDFYGLDL